MRITKHVQAISFRIHLNKSFAEVPRWINFVFAILDVYSTAMRAVSRWKFDLSLLEAFPIYALCRDSVTYLVYKLCRDTVVCLSSTIRQRVLWHFNDIVKTLIKSQSCFRHPITVDVDASRFHFEPQRQLKVNCQRFCLLLVNRYNEWIVLSASCPWHGRSHYRGEPRLNLLPWLEIVLCRL